MRVPPAQTHRTLTLTLSRGTGRGDRRDRTSRARKYLQARANVALGSMYGGMCLGPVNTDAAAGNIGLRSGFGSRDLNTTFNYPTTAEAYRVVALNGYNRLF